MSSEWCFAAWGVCVSLCCFANLLYSAACQVAGIFEFVGSIALGSETTKTIASDISRVSLYKDVPEIYM
jgi:phosphate/sulfate permease